MASPRNDARSSPPSAASRVTAGRPSGVRRGVIGVLCRKGRYLMIKRAAGIVKGGHWCFPGGHIENGENARQAVQRELAEELGIAVLPVERLGSVRTADGDYILAVWRVRLVDGVLTPAVAEVADFRWVGPREIATIAPGLASNELVARMIAEASSSTQ